MKSLQVTLRVPVFWIPQNNGQNVKLPFLSSSSSVPALLIALPHAVVTVIVSISTLILLLVLVKSNAFKVSTTICQEPEIEQEIGVHKSLITAVPHQVFVNVASQRIRSTQLLRIISSS